MIFLIADSGSTKTDWVLILSGNQKRYFKSEGINPNMMTWDEIFYTLKSVFKKQLRKIKPDRIFFYGAGFSSSTSCKKMENLFDKLSGCPKIEVRHDILGAARAVCGNEKGIVCILGTGSNSCLYNGKNILKIRGGSGYILGDEGSGAYIGKMLIKDMLDEKISEGIIKKFVIYYGETLQRIKLNVYKSKTPSAYLGKFTHFILKHKHYKSLNKIILNSLEDFVETTLCRYDDFRKIPIHFIGSIGYIFRKELLKVCRRYKIKVGKIVERPIDGLVEYHRNYFKPS